RSKSDGRWPDGWGRGCHNWQSNGIGIQSDRGSPGQQPAFYYCTGGHGDRGHSQYVSLEHRARSQSRRTADLPENVRRSGAAAQDHLATDSGGERGGHLEDEDSIRVALGVESEIPGGDLQRGRGFIQARNEGLAAEISR